MATLIGKPLGKVTQAISEVERARIFQSPLNKLWRLMILRNRLVSDMPKVADIDSDGNVVYSGKEANQFNRHVALRTSFSSAQKSNPWNQFRYWAAGDDNQAREIIKSRSTNFTASNKETLELIKNEIVIANFEVSPAVSIVIQNRPNELRVQPDATWAAVNSMGRNNPFYFYTSGEDTLSFEISWYVSDPNHRDEVLNKCRLLESWTRANGYSNSPPTLKIQWGNSGMFEDDLFILHSAPYVLTHFQNSARSGVYTHTADGIRESNQGMGIVDLKLLPNYATQTLTFKRVSTRNRTWEDIIPGASLRVTPGVNYDKDSVNFFDPSTTSNIW